MQRFLVAAFLLQLVLLVTLGGAIGAGPGAFVDKETGIVVKTATPEDTAVSFYALLEKGRWQPAYKLMTKMSRDMISEADMEASVKQVKIVKSRLVKVFPADQKGEFATVGHVRIIQLENQPNEMAIVGIAVLRQNPETRGWEIVRVPNEIESVYKDILDLILKTDEKMSREDFAGENLTKEQLTQIKDQIKAMKEMHEAQKEALNQQ
ncbi:hypothetical protein [Carboxydothermus hydrogenoformans]|uniref:Uncharacterized protein n=1 Tax=Carboxydothermus hydrogenoformans (strain ATCC BAA-161 / DSM 6008 / Z-2901) TaxID=246194 RepID=Q3AFI7_CARHZ|nr:hypothetical protein [Carboxydothermus hydrogenoformans]ABB14420.1 hypothetical protein CHY_0225 [Carboxydothermus hydrogenoformans Z-2901]